MTCGPHPTYCRFCVATKEDGTLHFQVFSTIYILNAHFKWKHKLNGSVNNFENKIKRRIFHNG